MTESVKLKEKVTYKENISSDGQIIEKNQIGSTSFNFDETVEIDLNQIRLCSLRKFELNSSIFTDFAEVLKIDKSVEKENLDSNYFTEIYSNLINNFLPSKKTENLLHIEGEHSFPLPNYVESSLYFIFTRMPIEIPNMGM